MTCYTSPDVSRRLHDVGFFEEEELIDGDMVRGSEPYRSYRADTLEQWLLEGKWAIIKGKVANGKYIARRYRMHGDSVILGDTEYLMELPMSEADSIPDAVAGVVIAVLEREIYDQQLMLDQEARDKAEEQRRADERWADMERWNNENQRRQRG